MKNIELVRAVVAFALLSAGLSQAVGKAASLPAPAASLPASAASAANDGVIHAQEGMKASAGHARPPFHLNPNVTSTSPSGLTPARVRRAYGFDQISNGGAGQVIAVVDAYDDPNIEADLGVFDTKFNVASCTTSNGCFRKIYASGTKPSTDPGWALEIALDVEWAHAIAPAAKIMLVEAKSSSYADLMYAVDVAVKNGATAVSMSFGGSEFSGETTYDSHFNVPGVTFTASSGDSGDGVEYPAASQYVVSVGGTTLNADSYGNYISESAWSGSGGGVSAYEPEPSGQANFPIPYAGKRGGPDVAYDANPTAGFAVYDSVTYNKQSGWFQVGGTSAGSPQWASFMAIVNSLRVAQGKAGLSAAYNSLYTVAKTAYGDYHDITTGSNGSCGTVCNAAGGYDYVTGLGSPSANWLVPALVSLP